MDQAQVLLALIYYADEAGKANPGIKTIATWARMSTPKARATLASLDGTKVGPIWLKIERSSGGPNEATHTYFMTFGADFGGLLLERGRVAGSDGGVAVGDGPVAVGEGEGCWQVDEADLLDLTEMEEAAGSATGAASSFTHTEKIAHAGSRTFVDDQFNQEGQQQAPLPPAALSLRDTRFAELDAALDDLARREDLRKAGDQSWDADLTPIWLVAMLLNKFAAVYGDDAQVDLGNQIVDAWPKVMAAAAERFNDFHGQPGRFGRDFVLWFFEKQKAKHKAGAAPGWGYGLLLNSDSVLNEYKTAIESKAHPVPTRMPANRATHATTN
jgi:hypothetical protein